MKYIAEVNLAIPKRVFHGRHAVCVLNSLLGVRNVMKHLFLGLIK